MSWAADLIRAQDGDVIVIPLALARALGLPAAAFLRQAAYLSAVVEDQHGWFFLEQEGPGNPAGKTIFERLGSWQSILGLGPDAQASIRRHLRSLALLEENRKMVHGKLRYRVDSERYLNFLASCSRSPLSLCNSRQTGNPDCTNGISGLNNQENQDCTIGENRGDIYEVDLGSGIKKQQHAPLVRAALGDAAAARSNEQKRRHPRRTANRIECWYPADDKPADDIEALFPAEQVAAAVAAVKARPNSVGKPTSPVPARVAEELERAQRAAEAAERHAAEETKRAAEAQSILPPDILRQRSAALAAAVRTGHFNTQEATA